VGSRQLFEIAAYDRLLPTAMQTFPKANRLLKRNEFRRAYDEGRKVQAKYFIAFVLPNQFEQTRLGITATRKFGKSVARNRARRLVREVFRRNRWLVPGGLDIVINVKGSLQEAGYKDLEADFLAFAERLKGQ
jgi:ribonuclease P protein component